MKSCCLVCTSPKQSPKVIYNVITRYSWKLIKFCEGLTKILATPKVKNYLPSLTMFQKIFKCATICIFFGAFLVEKKLTQWIKNIFHDLFSNYFVCFILMLSTAERYLQYMYWRRFDSGKYIVYFTLLRKVLGRWRY